jgi:transposase, IS605 orfB family
VFNRGLEEVKKYYETTGHFLNYEQLTAFLPKWKQDANWLKDCHSQVLQQSMKNLSQALINFSSGRANFPRFKAKGKKDSCRFPQGVKLDERNNRIYLPKIGWLRYRNSRKTIGMIKNVTVFLKCGKWYVSIQTEYEQEKPVHHGDDIGVDMGVVRFATLSNGQYFNPVNAFKTLKGKLAKLQQRLKRKTKGSSNWKKLVAKIGKLHKRIANIRKNFLHQISNTISKNHATVYVEDLQVKNMSKSAKGTVEKHGKKVKQKSGLNHAILDQAWYEFRRQLEYKLRWRGGQLILVSPQYTSQCCPACGHTAKENRTTQALFACVQCGYTENADVVGAINVLQRGRALSATG